MKSSHSLKCVGSLLWPRGRASYFVSHDHNSEVIWFIKISPLFAWIWCFSDDCFWCEDEKDDAKLQVLQSINYCFSCAAVCFFILLVSLKLHDRSSLRLTSQELNPAMEKKKLQSGVNQRGNPRRETYVINWETWSLSQTLKLLRRTCVTAPSVNLMGYRHIVSYHSCELYLQIKHI